MLYGVDVSFHKGYPDWGRAKASVAFALLGITELYGKDASFEHNYKGCQDNGIPCGGYKFSYASTGAESRKEADDIVAILGGRPMQMGIFIDLEWDRQTTLPESVLKDIIEQFREGIEAGGYVFGGIYCNLYWYRTYIPDYAKAKYKFWIASYPYNDMGIPVEGLRPRIPNLVGWQYSEAGTVPGFGAQGVDMDEWYEDIGGVTPKPLPEAIAFPVLSFGDTGEDVRKLQILLHAEPDFLIDGVFGPQTQKAVMAFQKAHGLAVDGIVGPDTWGALTGWDDEAIAREVLAGMWGDGNDRIERLTGAGYDYPTIQAIVNRLLEGK